LKSGHRARWRVIGLVALSAMVARCGNGRLTTDDARRLIEASPRFAAPDVMTLRPQYCSSVDAPSENVSAGTTRLKALEAAGAIRLQRRAAAPDECTSIPAPMRERVVVSLGDSAASFHPRALTDSSGAASGWEFVLARRQFVSIRELTFTSDDDPAIARAVYQWNWKAELLGQLLNVSEEPVNAQATFIKPDGEWRVRDVGF